jgi:3-mercaptopyruvate sulfurtransferase SseA
MAASPTRISGDPSVSVSGAQYVRKVREQVDEVDPSQVAELVDDGVAIIDVRESEEWSAGHLPGARHVPRGYLESRIDAAVPDRSQRVVLYCASGSAARSRPTRSRTTSASSTSSP